MSMPRVGRSGIGAAFLVGLLALSLSPAVPAGAASSDHELQLVQATGEPTPGRVDTGAERAVQSGGSLLLGILSLLLTGLVIGVVAKILMPGPDGGGIVSTSLLGVAGAFLGGLVASAIGVGGMRGLSIGSVVLSVLGAMALLLLQRRLRRA
jgi:uncharacterized membrane protein YeaQ/YmgE (transglycosylase-associated protein family)